METPDNLKPKRNESRANFMARCMTNSQMANAYDSDQRAMECSMIYDENMISEPDEDSDEMMELDLFGEVGGQITASLVSMFLAESGGKDVRLTVFSGGGSLFEGSAIYGMLKRYPGKVTADIVGLCASSASLIVMGADRIRMDVAGQMMIHNARGGVQGTPDEMRSGADKVEKMMQGMIQAYMSKTGMDEDEIKSLLDAETWMTAKEAKEMGFIDAIFEMEENEKMTASISPHLAQNYKNIPKNIEVKPDMKSAPKATQTQTKKQDSKMSEKNELVASMVPLLLAYNPEFNDGESENVSAEIVTAEVQNLTAKLTEQTETISTLETEKQNLEARIETLQADALVGKTQSTLDDIIAEAGVTLAEEPMAKLQKKVERIVSTEDQELADEFKEDAVAFAKVNGVMTGEDPLIPKGSKKNQQDPKATEPTMAPETGTDDLRNYEQKLMAKIETIMQAKPSLSLIQAKDEAKRELAIEAKN